MANAGDESKVAEAGRKERDIRKREILGMQAILDTEPGREFLWRLITRAKVFESIWDGSAKIHYNAGQQDFGHWIMAEITEANPTALVEMMMKKAKEGEANV